MKNKEKLDPEARKYLEQENQYAEHQLKDTKNIQKKLFDEIKGRIKLDDESSIKITHMNIGLKQLQKEIILLN